MPYIISILQSQLFLNAAALFYIIYSFANVLVKQWIMFPKSYMRL